MAIRGRFLCEGYRAIYYKTVYIYIYTLYTICIGLFDSLPGPRPALQAASRGLLQARLSTHLLRSYEGLGVYSL